MTILWYTIAAWLCVFSAVSSSDEYAGGGSHHVNINLDHVAEEATSDGSVGSDSKVMSDETVDISVSKVIQEIHKQWEEQQAAQNVMASLEPHEDSSDVSPSTEEISAVVDSESDVTLRNMAEGNATTNTSDSSDDQTNSSSIVMACNTGKENGGQPVELVNSTRLLNILITEPNITNRRMPAECVALLFFSRSCPFSSMAAPHFNALARAYPDIKMVAVDAVKYHSFNTQYGIVGVPTIMLFHNGRPSAKFNDSEYSLDAFSKFISKYTGIEPTNMLFVTSADFTGPVPSVPTKDVDWCLILSWVFILICGIYYFSKSSWWLWIVETVQNTWRESEAQHEHVE